MKLLGGFLLTQKQNPDEPDISEL